MNGVKIQTNKAENALLRTASDLAMTVKDHS